MNAGRRWTPLTSLLLLMSASTVAGADQMVETQGRMTDTVSDHQLHYLIQTPAGEPPADGWPVLLFLHGYGECGDDLQKVKVHGPPKLTEQFDLLSSCVIISPQCPKDSWWRVDALKSLMDEFVADHPEVNARRRYVTGLSMGGYGIWSFLSHYPDYFVAAVPICGGSDPLRLPKNRPPEKIGIKNEFDPEGFRRAANVPIWTFHGTEDGAVPIAETDRIVKMLKDAGSTSVRYTIYDDTGHVGAWEKAYEDPLVWGWLFEQR